MKQCPYCNAQIADDSKFCGECGKELPQENVCAHCGAMVNEGDIYCEECGRSVKDRTYASAEYGEKSGIDYMKILLSSLIGIVIGLVILAVVGGSWYGYNAYSEFSAAKQAREKFVADSLEQVKKDSIMIAEQKAQETIEAEKLAGFRNKMSFENFLGMLNHYEKESYAKRCGLSLLYKDVTEEEFGESIEIVYGYEVEKGDKKDWSYEILSKSNHACFFRYNLDTSTHASLSFKDKEEANIFFKKAKDYGLILHGDTYFIPNKKLPNGKGIVLDEDEYDNSIYEKVCGTISSPNYQDGWYVICIGIDFLKK